MESHEEWIAIAKSDLGSAKELINLEFYGQAVYNCQQTAEKTLKASLAFRREPIIKTHDLVVLVGLCGKYDASFNLLINVAQNLKPFATKFRYPTEYDIPDKLESLIVFKQAKKIYKFVLKKIEENAETNKTLF